ncbi:hypothetical protein [Kitasatospora sp. GAS204B]|uniref:hypothetical protein n=1 Tax=unclassified Kitasatospora TaxID=2633591 RepID=UPI00247709A3|nr:hypothetical protein [Kitasatospora sp. GAS204B]MDH6116675.1 hypothetical protein [Kitasatospora sp. GAS204B]
MYSYGGSHAGGRVRPARPATDPTALDAQLVDVQPPAPSPVPTPIAVPNALSGAFISTLGSNAGIPAVAGGVAVAAGGGALWLLKRRRGEKHS